MVLQHQHDIPQQVENLFWDAAAALLQQVFEP